MTSWHPEESVQFLRSRWHPDLVNRIVVRLNEGESIDGLLGDLPQHAQAPPDASRLDLRGIDLSHQNLRGPWISVAEHRQRAGVVLAHADLRYADLAWAMLPRADLRGALCGAVCFDNAELIRADFTGADLEGATFHGAWLLNTRFRHAAVSESQLEQRRNLGQLDFDYLAFVL